MEPNKRKLCLSFGFRVRALREQAGWSQEELALRADVHRTYIGGIERGERNPTLTTMARLAMALDQPLVSLLKVEEGE